MGRPRKHSKADILAAIKAAGGQGQKAADILDCSRASFYENVKHYDLSDELDAWRERRIDTAEGKLWEAIEDGQAWAICFYLKTQAQHRGYLERQKIDHSIGGKADEPLEFRAVFEDGSPVSAEAPFVPEGTGQ